MPFELHFTCADKVGILYIVTNILKSCNCNILSTKQIIENQQCIATMLIDDPYGEMQNVELLLKNGMPAETLITIQKK